MFTIDLSGKTAVVTGGGQGLGLATAEALAAFFSCVASWAFAPVVKATNTKPASVRQRRTHFMVKALVLSRFVLRRKWGRSIKRPVVRPRDRAYLRYPE